MKLEIHKTIRSPRRRRIKIEIDPNAKITLRVPTYATNDDITNFLESNYEWISNTLNKFLEQPPFLRQYINNENFLFLGTNYPLHISKERSVPFVFDGSRFIIEERVIKEAKEYFEKFYKNRANSIIKARVFDIAGKLGVRINKLRITSAQRRWGSCNSEGNVNFSWRLIMATPSSIDYVIIHEFCHLW